MRSATEPEAPVAVVCGSDSIVGSALVSRLNEAGWRVFTIDPTGVAPHPDSEVNFQGPLAEAATWVALKPLLHDEGVTPRAFVHAVSGFAGPDSPHGIATTTQEAAVGDVIRSATLGCEHVMPLMSRGDGAVVFVASVLAGWDVRPDTGPYSASQAGLLALMRSLAISGGPDRIRVNAVCTGLVADDHNAQAPLPLEVLGRIPLGRAASPDDVVDAIMFLLSPDAGHVDGSTLVVDGGQSLQSWSNAPRQSHYPLASSRRHDRTLIQERFRKRTVLITGAAGGLGSAAARRFAREGARLALLDRDGPGVVRLAEELDSVGGDALALEADIAEEQSLAAAIKTAEEHFGQIDVLFLNAGIGGGDLPLVDMPVEQWDEVLDINLRGVFLGCKLGVPALIRAGGGAIVNMGSSTGRHDTITHGAAYMASKAAVEALTKSLALQVAPNGIRANTICPGIIETRLSFRQQERGDAETFFAEFANRIPPGRVGQPEDVAAAVAFLASDLARHITGASLLIDGGQTLRRWISAPDLVPPPT